MLSPSSVCPEFLGLACVRSADALHPPIKIPFMIKPFELPVEMTIYSVAQTRDGLLAWLSEQALKPLEVPQISAAQVSEIDGAGLQLLVALSHTMQAWRLVGASEIFVDACQTLGLSTWFDGLTMTTPAQKA